MRALLAAIALLAPTLTFASNWQEIDKQTYDWMGFLPGKVTDGLVQHSPVTLLIDRDGIAKTGEDYRLVWWKVTAQKNGYVLDIINLESFNCRDHTYNVLKNGRRTIAYRPYDWSSQNGKAMSYVEPDSAEDHLFAAVCLHK